MPLPSKNLAHGLTKRELFAMAAMQGISMKLYHQRRNTMGDVLDLLYNFINDKPAPDAKHLSRMAIARIEHLQQQIKDLEEQSLTKRDQFAMAAMQGMLAHATRYKPREGASENWHEAISEEAVQLADALLAELDKAGGE